MNTNQHPLEHASITIDQPARGHGEHGLLSSFGATASPRAEKPAAQPDTDLAGQGFSGCEVIALADFVGGPPADFTEREQDDWYEEHDDQFVDSTGRSVTHTQRP